MSNKRLALSALGFLSGWLTMAAMGRAGLISSVSYNQVLNTDSLGEINQISSLVGTSLPVSQTTSINPVSNNPSISATYNFTDNGLVAQFSIQSTANLTALDQSANERSNQDIEFTLSKPATYRVTGLYTPVNPAFDSVYLLSMGDGRYNDVDIFQVDTVDSTATHSGTLAAGIPYLFNEGWVLDNGTTSVAGTGAGSVVLTFTAIPEPSSLCLAILTTSALCRRRKASR